MSKEKFLWDIVSVILTTHGDEVDNISIHEHSDSYENEHRKIYCSLGYCFELSKEEADENEVHGVENGYVYSFNEPWEGFKAAGIDEAINLLNEYAGLKIEEIKYSKRSLTLCPKKPPVQPNEMSNGRPAVGSPFCKRCSCYAGIDENKAVVYCTSKV